jgi:hypothetical protein
MAIRRSGKGGSGALYSPRHSHAVLAYKTACSPSTNTSRLPYDSAKMLASAVLAIAITVVAAVDPATIKGAATALDVRRGTTTVLETDPLP